MKILVLNGPNINMLGLREPDIYGKEDYASLCQKVRALCQSEQVACEIYQSNHEGDLIDKIQSAYGNTDGIVFNPGGYTHTSVALLDALLAVGIPTVEVHISDVKRREEFRKNSYIRSACVKTICGHGTDGYTEGIRFLLDTVGK